MKLGTLVYISGPLSATVVHSVEQNVAEAVKLYMLLLERKIPAFCPHLCSAFPSAWTKLNYDFWMAYDFAVIERCTHVLMMPLWLDSKGATLEHQHAAKIGKPIAYNVEDLERQLNG